VKELEKRITNFINMGASSSTLLHSLIEDILDLSKMEAGTFTLNVSSFMIPDLLKDTIELFEYQCKLKNLQLIVDVDPSLVEQPCKSDHGRIKQILMNLISNALKFTFEGHIKVRAELIVRNEKGNAKFTVSDTGVGIPKKDHKKLFKLFGMLELNKEMNKNGCGIGLTVSRKYAEALGGQIWINSVYKEGASVSFTVPYPDNTYIMNDSLEF
jgi:two-component system, NarL family, sensor histidine kinase BarA